MEKERRGEEERQQREKETRQREEERRRQREEEERNQRTEEEKRQRAITRREHQQKERKRQRREDERQQELHNRQEQQQQQQREAVRGLKEQLSIYRKQAVPRGRPPKQSWVQSRRIATSNRLLVQSKRVAPSVPTPPNNYTFLEIRDPTFVAEGGFGSVSRATVVVGGVTVDVAVKTARSGAECSASLADELVTLNILRGIEGVVDLLGVSSNGSIVLEWVPTSLDECFTLSCQPAACGALSFLATFMSSMNEILAEVHRHNVRHGDLKPANIGWSVLTSKPIVCDWGMSQVPDPHSGTRPFKIGPNGVFFEKYPWSSPQVQVLQAVDYFQTLMITVDYMLRSSSPRMHLHKLLHTHKLFSATKVLGSNWVQTNKDKAKLMPLIAWLLTHDEGVCDTSLHDTFCNPLACRWKGTYQKEKSPLADYDMALTRKFTCTC